MKYEYAESFERGTAVVGIGVKYGVINKNQAIIVPMIYDEIYRKGYNTSYYVVRKGKEWGVLDHSGKVFIPLKDRGWAPVIDYFAFGAVDGGYRFVAQLFDSNGKALLPDGCFVSNEINEGKNGLWNTGCGCYNMNTKKLETGFRFSTRFSDGLVKVVDDNRRCGLMEAVSGELLLPIEYDDILAANEERFKVVKDGVVLYKDRNGDSEYVLKKEINELFLVTKDGKYGLIEENMNFIVDCMYDEIVEMPLTHGAFLRCSKDGKYGMLIHETDSNKPKHIIRPGTPLEYDRIFTIPCQIKDYGQSYVFCYCKGGKWAIGNRQPGTEPRPETGFVFDCIPEEKDSYWLVMINGKYGLYTKDKLAEYVSCVYDEITLSEIASYNNGYDVWTVKKDGYYGVIHGNRLAVPCEFEEITWFGQFVKLRKNGKCDFVISQYLPMNSLPRDFRFEDIAYMDSGFIGSVYSGHYYLFAVKMKNKCGYIKVNGANLSGELVIKPKYDTADKFINGKALVEKGGKKFYIDENGKKVK